MKKLIVTLFIGLFIVTVVYSQPKLYSTSGWEMIFSWADVNYNGDESGAIMRWAPVLNIQGALNYDVAKSFGLFTGLAIRNVGYIYNNFVDREGYTVKKKFRTYNIGIPVGIKVGNLDKLFIYAGYDFEFPFHYKEKTFKDESKTKDVQTFFSNRVEQFQHGIIVGIQFPYGANLKFKYYFSEFHNQGYTESDGYMPYAGLKSNVLYISLNFSMFRNAKFYYEDEKKGSEYY